MTYREPDPDRQAEAERQLAAEEQLDDAAAGGREARVRGAPDADKRLVRASSADHLRVVGAVAPLAIIGAVVAGAGGALAAVIGAGAVGASILGAAGLHRLRLRREEAWLRRLPFPVIGYVQVLAQNRTVTAISARITLAAIEPDDRNRVLDLLAHLDTVDPDVAIDGTTIAIDVLRTGSVQRFMRALIERVALALHEARTVELVQIVASTADPPTRYDQYG